MPLRFTVEGMHCSSCKMLIEDELEEIGARDINVLFDPKTQLGTVICDHDEPERLAEAIRALGDYTVKGDK